MQELISQTFTKRTVTLTLDRQEYKVNFGYIFARISQSEFNQPVGKNLLTPNSHFNCTILQMLLSMQREKNIQKNYCPNCGVILTIFKFQEFSKTPRNATAINTNKSLKEILSWINDVLPSFSWLPSRSIWVHIGAVCHLAVLQSHRMFASAASHQQQLSCGKDNILYSLYQY